MENTKEETTQQNPEVEETSETPQEETQEEETSPEENETPKEKTESYSDRERRYYARMKEAEDSAKKAREDLEKTRKELAKAKIPISDVDAILEVQSSTRDLDPTEIAELKLRASALGVSLTEARKDDNYLMWQKAYNDKVAKEQIPPPSTTQSEAEKEKTFTEKLAETENNIDWRTQVEEKEKLLTEKGMYKSMRRRPDATRIKLSE